MIRWVLLVLFIVVWFLNYPILSGMYDLESCIQQYEFWKLRSKVYELMFFILSVVCFLSLKGFAKSVSCFVVVIIAGSIVDKMFFGVTGYVLADILLIVLALVASVIVYRNERRFKLDRDASKLVN